ncbi:unnamed protein product [Choristocarpus tenellus]
MHLTSICASRLRPSDVQGRYSCFGVGALVAKSLLSVVLLRHRPVISYPPHPFLVQQMLESWCNIIMNSEQEVLVAMDASYGVVASELCHYITPCPLKERMLVSFSQSTLFVFVSGNSVDTPNTIPSITLSHFCRKRSMDTSLINLSLLCS